MAGEMPSSGPTARHEKVFAVCESRTGVDEGSAGFCDPSRIGASTSSGFDKSSFRVRADEAAVEAASGGVPSARAVLRRGAD